MAILNYGEDDYGESIISIESFVGHTMIQMADDFRVFVNQHEPESNFTPDEWWKRFDMWRVERKLKS